MSEWREEWREANRANWDERVPIHASGEFYDVASFKAGEERLQSFEVAEVGDVSGKDLLHLQCHFGIDTLSWARRGARVVDLDGGCEVVADEEAVEHSLPDLPEPVDTGSYDYVGLLV